mmetsp:Transcript_51920/g.118395  ORF Transcript_51920/g.118395 Transcript_51920/m.118395 type:complete len:92 (-) Transcript_51920:810-1085(-)
MGDTAAAKLLPSPAGEPAMGDTAAAKLLPSPAGEPATYDGAETTGDSSNNEMVVSPRQGVAEGAELMGAGGGRCNARFNRGTIGRDTRVAT